MLLGSSSRSPKRLALLALLGVMLLAVWAWQHRQARQPLDVSDWDVPRLVDHLHRRGLRLNAAATMGAAGTPETVIFSAGPIDRTAFARLVRSHEHISDWQGVVECRYHKNRAEQAREREDTDSYQLERGPFFFFGDPSLVASIDDALRGND